MKAQNNKNYGLEILRMILCFWVVLFHCLRKTDNNIILNFKRKMFHVPSFFFISFYFIFPIIREKNTNKMILRLERLLIPYLFWPLITYAINNLLFLYYKRSRFNRLLTLYELFEQLITGRKFYVQFWFLSNLLLITIFLFILSFFLAINIFLKILQAIGIISYFLQYSTYNYIFFDNYKDCISHSLGHIIETFPMAITAFIINKYNIPNRMKSIRYTIILYCILGNYFIYNYKIFSEIQKYGHKYNYNGLEKNIFAMFSFFVFYLIPIEYIKSNKLIIFINIVSKYTQGIYCLHPIANYFATNIIHIKKTFNGCLIIYLISYLMSFTGDKISFKTRAKLLFI